MNHIDLYTLLQKQTCLGKRYKDSVGKSWQFLQIKNP